VRNWDNSVDLGARIQIPEPRIEPIYKNKSNTQYTAILFNTI